MQARPDSVTKQCLTISIGPPADRGDRVTVRYSRVCSEVGVEGFPVWYRENDVTGHFLF